MRPITRRQFNRLTASLLAVPAAEAVKAPTVVSTPRRPLVIGSANGNEFKNGGDRTGVAIAFAALTAGQDPLDAVIAGVNVVELDPLETSVGYGGLPNADGVVQLDSSCMHGPSKRAGAVAALEGVRTPSLVAKAVLEQTDHHLLVGEGAQRFARQTGFTIEPDLNTETSRRRWLEWKRLIDPEHWLDPKQRGAAADRARETMIAAGTLDPWHAFGTIHMAGLTAAGDLGGVTTTSGLAFKIPGRVGDSPILGAGNYVDNSVGSCGSTGRGEANLFGLSSFLVVELMRAGKHPKDAVMEALSRIRSNTIEKRLFDEKGVPKFNVTFYAMNRQGVYAGACLHAAKGARFAVCDSNGPRHEDLEALIA